MLNLLNCCNACSLTEGINTWGAGKLGRKWEHILKAVLLLRCLGGGHAASVPTGAYWFSGLTCGAALMTSANGAPVT